MVSPGVILGIYPAVSYIQVFGGDRLCWRSSSGSSGSVRAQDWLDLQDRLWGSEKFGPAKFGSTTLILYKLTKG